MKRKTRLGVQFCDVFENSRRQELANENERLLFLDDLFDRSLEVDAIISSNKTKNKKLD